MALGRLSILKPNRARPTTPMEIFNSSRTTLRGKIQNLWEPQASALRQWEEVRESKDVVVKMNTGGGKTLVGLLIAQSIVNDTGGKVLYVCPTNQLVEQVTALASEIGLPVARYFDSTWTNREVYLGGQGFCITNYAALFNSLSIFKREELSGIIFDDAHVAQSAIRGQYTVSITRAAHQEFYNKIIAVFQSYIDAVQKSTVLEEVYLGNTNRVIYIPIFESAQKCKEIQKILENAQLVDDKLKFPIGSIRDHLHLCTIIIAADRIEIAPPLLPIRTLRYFDNAHRIYLTATLPSSVEFLRLFGASDAKTISPTGKLGAAQRLVLFANGNTDDEQRLDAQTLTASMKSCVIVPSNKSAENWAQFQVYGGNGDQEIREFATNASPRKLVLVARFDGVDLPGNTCQILIMDGLPTGSFLFERFLDQGLRISRIRRTNITTRIIQGMGRIFRSNTDHGVIILCGRDLQDWVVDSESRPYFPPLLQHQIEFSIALQSSIRKGETTPGELIGAILQGDPNWDEYYSQFIADAAVRDKSVSVAWADKCALLEREGYEMLWNSDHDGAAELFDMAATLVPTSEKSQYAWIQHLRGFALFLAGRIPEARQALSLGAAQRSELGRLDPNEEDPSESTIPNLEQAEILVTRLPAIVSDLQELELRLAKLQYGRDTDGCEDALKSLGFSLGLQSIRPDKQDGTGPDVLWRSIQKRFAMGFECKTNKEPTGMYKKKEDIGQIGDHYQYLENEYPNESHDMIIVGRYLSVAEQANPRPGLKIVSIDQFQDLARRTVSFIKSIKTVPLSVTSVARGLSRHQLIWPDCLERLESRLAVDLKESNQA